MVIQNYPGGYIGNVRTTSMPSPEIETNEPKIEKKEEPKPKPLSQVQQLNKEIRRYEKAKAKLYQESTVVNPATKAKLEKQFDRKISQLYEAKRNLKETGSAFYTEKTTTTETNSVERPVTSVEKRYSSEEQLAQYGIGVKKNEPIYLGIDKFPYKGLSPEVYEKKEGEFVKTGEVINKTELRNIELASSKYGKTTQNELPKATIPKGEIQPTSKKFGSTPLYDIQKATNIRMTTDYVPESKFSQIVGGYGSFTTGATLGVIKMGGELVGSGIKVIAGSQPVKFVGGAEYDPTTGGLKESSVISQTRLVESSKVTGGDIFTTAILPLSEVRVAGKLLITGITTVGTVTEFGNLISAKSISDVGSATGKLALFSLGFKDTKNVLNLREFNTQNILGGTIRTVPRTVSSSVRGIEFLKKEGITPRTYDVTNTLSYASYSPKEYVKVGEIIKKGESQPIIIKLASPEPRQVRTITTPVYKGLSYEIVEGRAVPTKLSEPIGTISKEIFTGEAGNVAKITDKGLVFEPTGKIPLVEVSRYPFEKQELIAKIPVGRLPLEFTSRTINEPSLARVKAEADIQALGQPLTFKNINVGIGEVTLPFNKIQSSNVFERVIPTERGLTTFELKRDVSTPSLQSFEPLKVKLVEGISETLLDVRGINIEPTVNRKVTGSFRIVKSNVEPDVKLNVGESVTKSGEVLTTKEPDTIVLSEQIAKPSEVKTETFLDVYGKTQPTVSQSQSSLTGLSESVGETSINKLPKSKSIPLPLSKSTSTLKSNIANIEVSKSSLDNVSILQTKQSVEPLAIVGYKSSTELLPMIKTSRDITPKQALEQKQDIEQKQALEQVTDTRNVFSRRIVSRGAPEVPIPEVPIGRLTITSKKDKTKKSKSKLYVKKKGKFELKGVSEDTGLLFKKGLDIVRTTASASAKVVSESGRAILPNILPSDFTKSKRSEGVIVQKREKRISTAGEKFEIPGKAKRLKQTRRLI